LYLKRVVKAVPGTHKTNTPRKMSRGEGRRRVGASAYEGRRATEKSHLIQKRKTPFKGEDGKRKKEKGKGGGINVKRQKKATYVGKEQKGKEKKETLN